MIVSQVKIHVQEKQNFFKESKQTDFTKALSTYRFLDFFFFVPSGPTSQLQGDPELS